MTYASNSCSGGPGLLYALDGATGTQLFETEPVFPCIGPAAGDIDGDGIVEIVASTPGNQVIAFDNDGSTLWTGAAWNTEGTANASFALADLDNDGDVEILAGNMLVDHLGQQVLTFADDGLTGYAAVPTAADLDDDEDLEVVFGRSAYHHDGTELYFNAQVGSGFPSVADLDDDPNPEVLVNNVGGLTLLSHAGTVQYQDLTPTGDPPTALNWYRPSTVHDFDGDGTAEFAVSSASHYSVFEQDATVVWSADIDDASGFAAGTAFDFLGDGTAEAMYADEHNMFVFDGAGVPLLNIPRASYTRTEYPAVADVDNDGSAEIVVVSNIWLGDLMPPEPTVRVIRDARDRWIQARRIWNQHTYHVTNVREDGTIPEIEPHHWEHLNTFRTNAQIEGGVVCKPEPEG